MADYLAQIAEKTLPCPVTLTYPKDDGSPHGPSCDCRDTGHVLDPRFDGLREECLACHCEEGHISDPCQKVGYTVVRDLGVLLECARKLSYHLGLYWDYEDVEWRCTIKDPKGWVIGYGHEPLEVAAKAVWKWLEAEEKVTT